MNFDLSQLMRGTLEGCILKIISCQTTYGYEILKSLKLFGFQDISEGTIYPLLLRLEKQDNIVAKLLPSPLGPKRKYYSITNQGLEYLHSFEVSWVNLSRAVADVLGLAGE
ncbi:MAG TPA: PadR family transcriptional regulator [Clostridiales bacterium]|nr:PadR family transcriptional regulator [Clostridiales bacterium]HCG35829.1 PadR family transcriptional regulator [Clostridiales bacterium]